MIHVARLTTAALALTAAWILFEPARVRPQRAPEPVAPLTTRSGDSAERPFHGMAIQLHGTSAELPAFRRLIDEVAELGANSVMLVTHGWQQHAATIDLHFDTTRSLALDDVAVLCDHARQKGLRVIVMPVVLLKSPRNTEWRGQINPTAGWDAWFRRYTEFMLEHARMCHEHGVSLLMIGSELIKAEKHTDRWAALIAAIRREYGGHLGYSSNWDHYTTDKIGFWPLLDYVGMTSYYTLASGPRPPLSEVMQRWTPIKERILKFHDEVRKPIIFTEVGWCSQEGAAYEAWNYYHNQKATPEGLQEQATCYEAFMRTWDGVPQVGGTLWWEWTALPGGPDDFNYTPKGKPAERLLRDWFARNE